MRNIPDSFKYSQTLGTINATVCCRNVPDRMCIAGCNIATDSLSKPRQTIEIQYDIEANSENSTKEKGELARTLCRHVHRYSVSIRSRYKAILRSFAASHEFTTIYRSFQKPDQNSGANGLFKFTQSGGLPYTESV